MAMLTAAKTARIMAMLTVAMTMLRGIVMKNAREQLPHSSLVVPHHRTRSSYENTIAFDTRLQVLRNIRSQLTTQHTYYTAVMQRHNAILKRIQAEIEATKAKQSRTKERLDMVQRAEAHVSATRCRIFRVPLEIRRIIYEFVLAVDNDLELQDPARLQFLLTCHKFHDEAKHMAYQSQHFRVHWVTGYASGSVGPQLDTKIKRLPHGMMRDIRTLVLPLNKYGFGPGGQSRTDFEKEYLRRIFMRLGGRGYFCLSKVQVVKFYHHKRAGSERLLQITMNRTDEILDVDQSNHQHQVWQVTLHPGHLSRLSNLDYIANGRFLARLR
ncbi:hypothetical protein DL546_007509 [Coniochaeta pulveracea]|uniref:Uncharacterized protein n=1 Tax=Coniochaeta pulveracea TaxID=177199 RepID=A0A420YKZ6_9PEZI|nr:hypothetical protein DL546_007509 [Coniochaeta pulveracea]